MKTRDELLRRPERRDLLVSWMGLVGQYQDPVFLVNRYNEIITVNKPALRLIRQEKSKILGKKINVFEGTIIDLEEIDSKKEALENIGYFRCYSLLKIKKNKEYLTELTINRLPLRNDDYCYLYQFAIEEKRNIEDYKDVEKLKNISKYLFGIKSKSHRYERSETPVTPRKMLDKFRKYQKRKQQ